MSNIAKQLDKANAALNAYGKGLNINNGEQLKEYESLKNKVKELESLQRSITCDMCGKEAPNKISNRWYQYDNGEQFIARVCPKCAALHNQLVKKG